MARSGMRQFASPCSRGRRKDSPSRILGGAGLSRVLCWEVRHSCQAQQQRPTNAGIVS